MARKESSVNPKIMDRQSQLSLLDNLPGMVFRCSTDRQRKMVYVSPGCLDLTGYTVGELIDDRVISYADLIVPDDREKVAGEIEGAVQEGRAYTCTYRLITADGRERWVWESGQCSFDEKGACRYLDGFITDATEQVVALQHLEQSIDDRTRKLSALYDISEMASASTELSAIINKSLRRVLSAARGDAGFIHLREKSGKTLRLVARVNISKSMIDKINVITLQDGLVAWVFRNNQALVIPLVDADPRTLYLGADVSLKAYMGVPVATRERVFGTLSVLSKEPSQFGDDEIELLVSIGEQLGVTVENVRLRRQAERLLVIQERNRLARELHDSVTQSLYSLTLFAEAGRRMAEAGRNDEASEYISQIGETGQQALKEMRLLVHKLRPSILAKEGLTRALQQRLNSVEARAGVKSQLIVQGEAKLSPPLEDALYQIAQEALNNALKHAMASEVIVRLDLRKGGEAVVRVEDNGRGFDPYAAAESDGMGFTSMRERVEMFNGELAVRSSPGRGTTVEAHLGGSPIAPREGTEFDVEDLE